MGRRSRSRSRDRGEKRSRRRSRSRSRSRDRSDRRERRFSSGTDDAVHKAQQAALMALQQQQLQKQLLAQQQLMQQQALSSSSSALSNKKQREVYVGNLTIGVVTDIMLRDLFNASLAHLCGIEVAPGQDISAHPNAPVVTVRLDSTGRFGFVEMRTEELSHHAMNLDKVELCGRQVNVGRPKGYVESASAPPPPAIGAAAAFAAQLSQEPTTVLRLDNLVKARLLLNPQEQADMLEDLREEASKYGELAGIAAPLPPPTITALEPARVYLKYSQLSESAAAKEVFHSRVFDDNAISARYAPEMEYVQAEAGIFDAHINSGLAPGMAAPGMSTAAGQMPSPPGMMPAQQLPPPPAIPVGGFT